MAQWEPVGVREGEEVDEGHAALKGAEETLCGEKVAYQLGAGEPTCKPCADAAWELGMKDAEAMLSGDRVCRSSELGMRPCAEALYLVGLEGLPLEEFNTVSCESHLGLWAASSLNNKDHRRVTVERYYRNEGGK